MEIGDASSDEGEEEDEEEDSDEEDAAEAMHNTLPLLVGVEEAWPALLTARQQHVEQIVDGRVKGESMTSGDIADLVAGDSIPPAKTIEVSAAARAMSTALEETVDLPAEHYHAR